MIPIILISRNGKITLLEILSVTAWGVEGRLKKDTKKLSGMMVMWMYTFVRIYQAMHLTAVRYVNYASIKWSFLNSHYVKTMHFCMPARKFKFKKVTI